MQTIWLAAVCSGSNANESVWFGFFEVNDEKRASYSAHEIESSKVKRLVCACASNAFMFHIQF